MIFKEIVVKNNLVVGTDIEVDSDRWFILLNRIRGFTYEPLDGDINGMHPISVLVRNNLSCYATRKVGYCVRREHLGTINDITYSSLMDVCSKLSLPSDEYWNADG